MKRKLGVKRDLLEPWLNILTEMMEAGQLLASLEYYDDNPALKRFKRSSIELREKIRKFTLENIEPIRLKNVFGMQQSQESNNGETQPQ